MKTRKLLASLLALVLVIGCMGVPVSADDATELSTLSDKTTWPAGNYKVSSSLEINGTVTVTGNVTLTIAKDAILTINGAKGTAATGLKTGTLNGEDGGDGGNGITINENTSLSVTGEGTLIVNGGSGGKGANGDFDPDPQNWSKAGGNGGDGGNGGAGIFAAGSLIVNCATFKAKGGDGGGAGTFSQGVGGVPGQMGAYGTGGIGLHATGVMNINNGQIQLVGGLGLDGWGTENNSAFSFSNASITGGLFNVDVKAYVANGYKWESNTDATTLAEGYTYKVVAITSSIAFTPATTTPVFEAGVANAGAAIGVLSASDFSGTVTYTPTVYDAKTGGNVVDTNKIFAAMATDKKTLGIVTTANVTAGTYYVAVSASDGTDTVTLADRIEVQVFPATTGSIDLDLEDDTADILESHDIDQYYIKTEKKVIVHTVLIHLYWEESALEIKVADAKKWDPATLSWKVDNGEGGKHGVASMEETTVKKTMKLVNLSANAFNCTLTFTESEALAEDLKGAMTVDITNDNTVTPGQLDEVEVDAETGKALAKYFTGETVNEDALPQLTFTATVTVDTSKFKNAAATTSNVSYGTFKLECTHIDEAN